MSHTMTQPAAPLLADPPAARRRPSGSAANAITRPLYPINTALAVLALAVASRATSHSRTLPILSTLASRPPASTASANTELGCPASWPAAGTAHPRARQRARTAGVSSVSKLCNARSPGRWSSVVDKDTAGQLDMHNSTSPAGRLPTSALPTMVSLTSSSRRAGRGDSTAACVRLLHPRTLRLTSVGGRVASEPSPMALLATCRVCSAGRCANDASRANPLSLPACNSCRLGGSDASMLTCRLLASARSTRRLVRNANDVSAGVALPLLISSSRNDGGRLLSATATFVQLQSSDTSDVRCVKLARSVSAPHRLTINLCREVGRRRTKSSVTSTMLCKSRCTSPASTTAVGVPPGASRPTTA